MREKNSMMIRYSLIPVFMALCICSSVVTGISPGFLSNSDASSIIPVTTVMFRPGESPVTEPGIGIAIIPLSPEGNRLVLPVQAIGEPATVPGVMFLEPLPSDQAIWIPWPVPVQGIPCPDHSFSTPVIEPGPVTGQLFSRMVNGTGTIRWIDLEGGFYGIESDDGDQYLPLNLGDAYQADGMRIRFSAYPAADMTIAMWGTPVTLISVAGENEASAGFLMNYHRTGGIAGFEDDLTLYENGSASTSRNGGVRSIRLNNTEFDALRDAFDRAGFQMLSPEYLPDGEGCDLFFYAITWEGTTVLTADTAVPEELMPLIELLNGIVSQVPPR